MIAFVQNKQAHQQITSYVTVITQVIISIYSIIKYTVCGFFRSAYISIRTVLVYEVANYWKFIMCLLSVFHCNYITNKSLELNHFEFAQCGVAIVVVVEEYMNIYELLLTPLI